MVIRIVADDGERAWGDASSVDELIEHIDDLIDTMELPDEEWLDPDHEEQILKAADALDDEQLSDIRQRIASVAAEADADRPYMEYRGFEAHVTYVPERGMIEARFENDIIAPVEARSLKRLYHYFLMAAQEHIHHLAEHLDDEERDGSQDGKFVWGPGDMVSLEEGYTSLGTPNPSIWPERMRIERLAAFGRQLRSEGRSIPQLDSQQLMVHFHDGKMASMPEAHELMRTGERRLGSMPYDDDEQAKLLADLHQVLVDQRLIAE